MLGNCGRGRKIFEAAELVLVLARSALAPEALLESSASLSESELASALLPVTWTDLCLTWLPLVCFLVVGLSSFVLVYKQQSINNILRIG